MADRTFAIRIVSGSSLLAGAVKQLIVISSQLCYLVNALDDTIRNDTISCTNYNVLRRLIESRNAIICFSNISDNAAY